MLVHELYSVYEPLALAKHQHASMPVGVQFQVFPGSADSNTARTHAFSPGTEILAHGVRLHPGSIRGTASMRFELLGCKWG